ncbi:MAG: beta-hydroxyacyl-ACP dehydratase [Planctomycetes bacterium]|nr:beta-hydroxyacyl-ACP dehydratase [Planctomycetota bacterium]
MYIISQSDGVAFVRWIWIDRFLEFESGKFAKSVKNVTLAEDHLHDHFPGFPVMPASLMIEGLAQTGGLLVGEVSGFEEKVILAKIGHAIFHGWVQPGDQIIYETHIRDQNDQGAMIEGKATVQDRLVADVELFYAFLDESSRAKKLFEPKNFVFTMRILGVFDVGKSAEGDPLLPPGLENFHQAADESPMSGPEE